MPFELKYVKRNCCLCHDCKEYCPSGAISLTEDGLLTWDNQKCSKCETCIDICINEALVGLWEAE